MMQRLRADDRYWRASEEGRTPSPQPDTHMSIQNGSPGPPPGRRSYHDLFLWRQGMELAGECIGLVKRLPAEERFALVREILQAAVAIPSNIAAGTESDSRKAFLRHLDIARGKLRRLESCLAIAREVGYFEANDDARARLLTNEIDGLLDTLIGQLAAR